MARLTSRGAGSLFTYGSLEFAEIMEIVTGRPCAGRPARLDGYARRTLPGFIYPGITRAPGESTPGTLYRDLAAADLAVLDAFEGDAYDRIETEVHTAEGRTVRALVYVAPGLAADLHSAPAWEPTEFVARHWESVVADCRAFRAQWLTSVHTAREARPPSNHREEIP